MSEPTKIVIPGGAGFLGHMLARHFAQRGHEVVVFTRRGARSDAGVRFVSWDGRTMGDWQAEMDGAAAVINLSGRSVNCRYNAENRRQIMDSRVLSTRVIGEAIARCERPPAVWINSGTATIYKHSLDRPMDETAGEMDSTKEAKDAFSVEVALAWEKALQEAATPQTRKIVMRLAMVMGTEAGSVFRVLRRLVRLGLGGRMGRGNQYVSWIHEEDFCRSVDWMLDHPQLAGPVNVTAPNPIPNRDMMHVLRHACHIPIGLPASRWMLEVGAFLLRTETELMIKSRRVVPGRLLADGFEFHFPDIQSAVADLESRL